MSGPAGQSESGADFRQKFEDLLSERNALAEVSKTLAASMYQHLKPADFEGVEPSKYAEHAAEIHQQRTQEREAMFAEMAKERGLDVSASSEGGKTPTKDDAASRFASLGELGGGNPPSRGPNLEGLEGRALLAAYYANQEANGSK